MKLGSTILSLVPVLALAIASHAAAQQMYKWVGADGKVNYTDTPPPASAKSAEAKGPVSASENSPALTYELAQVARTSPVVLYTMSSCVPCDNARSLLSTRGIPYTEKTVATVADSERLKQAGGDGTMPMLLVGRAKQIGFEPAAWGTMLSAAGYPESSRLPSGYRNPPPTPADPAAPVALGAGKANSTGSAAEAAPAPVKRPPPPGDKGVPGFRF
ncbi:glutaredoxin family protein [Actimicrobium antarcticum]|uniref:Glutaredoxin n=1 Tax=Actimicrobium antarcticum TaxID=1051899 RepID=A0ABP7THW0_9BURK